MFKILLKLEKKLKSFLHKICKSKKNINNIKTLNDEEMFIYSKPMCTPNQLAPENVQVIMDESETKHFSEEEICNINRELNMFQQMCFMFGRKYTLTYAAEYLEKANYDICKKDIANLYLTGKITFITDFRDNKNTEFSTFMESC